MDVAEGTLKHIAGTVQLHARPRNLLNAPACLQDCSS